jgi:hypothetical protein
VELLIEGTQWEDLFCLMQIFDPTSRTSYFRETAETFILPLASLAFWTPKPPFFRCPLKRVRSIKVLKLYIN